MVPERGEVRSCVIPILLVELDHSQRDEECPDPLGEVLVEVRLLAESFHVGHVGRAFVFGLDPPRHEHTRDGSIPVAAVRRAILLPVADPEVRDRQGRLSLDELSKESGSLVLLIVEAPGSLALRWGESGWGRLACESWPVVKTSLTSASSFRIAPVHETSGSSARP